jgi:hypothetical protein
MSDGTEGGQDRSGHRADNAGAKNPQHDGSPGSIPEGQSKSGHAADEAGSVNSSRAGGSDQNPVQNERGYTKDSEDSRSTKKTNDGVRSPFDRIG